MRAYYRGPVIVIVSCSLLSLPSCGPPAEILPFAAAAQQTLTETRALVMDIRASCIRQHMAEQAPTDVSPNQAEAEAPCQRWAPIEPQVLTTVEILARYFGELKQLANSRTNVDAEIDHLGTRLQQVSDWPPAATSAAQHLATTAAKMLLGGYQQRHLARALTQTDHDIDVITQALEIFVGREYTRSLGREQSILRSRYRRAFTNQAGNEGMLLLIQDRWAETDERIVKRQSAAQECQRALAAIREGHHALVVHAQNWSTRDALAKLPSATLSIEEAARELRRAF